MEEEEGFLGDDEAVFLKGGGGDEGVGDAGLIFEADEEMTFRGAGALAADDLASEGEPLSVFAAKQIAGTPDVGESVPQIGHGVRACGEVQGIVVCLEALCGGHGVEGGGVLGAQCLVGSADGSSAFLGGGLITDYG